MTHQIGQIKQMNTDFMDGRDKGKDNTKSKRHEILFDEVSSKHKALQ
ncbi:hypothetical protein K4L44_08145 [Halosquirtibacter laminarini]|uniref:Uncharacterized protein n=1 Tax=Halosquirtibacter laminarini TaxID=3374600 RepID=A0AC61NRC6_9BACT|nr:hypothetical protein K4L44_08145 [Prolixibacteraceae bacterium]